jgi:hypothetical protein
MSPAGWYGFTSPDHVSPTGEPGYAPAAGVTGGTAIPGVADMTLAPTVRLNDGYHAERMLNVPGSPGIRVVQPSHAPGPEGVVAVGAIGLRAVFVWIQRTVRKYVSLVLNLVPT